MQHIRLNPSPSCGLSVVVPCFNEDGNIPELHRRIRETCSATVGEDYEIVLVNDGSTDATWAEIRSLQRENSQIVGVNLSRNYGHQIALSAGLSVCRGSRILILDADLQDPPELLPRMMAEMDAGADVVYGMRAERLAESRFKRLSAGLFYRLMVRIADISIPVDTGDFRLMSRRALDALNDMPEQHRFIRGMVSWIGFKQVAIPYQRQPRHSGETKYPLSKMIRFALDAVTGFSVRPLRIASYFGAASGLCAIVMLAYALHSWFTGNAVAGWTSVIAIILLLGTSQLIVMGIVGEYLGRLYMESKRRPLFIIQDLCRAPRDLDTQSIDVTDEHAIARTVAA